MPRIVTDANGRAVFSGAPGTYTADVIPPQGYRDIPNILVADLQDGEVRELGDFFLDQVQAGFALALRDRATGAPLAGVAIDVT